MPYIITTTRPSTFAYVGGRDLTTRRAVTTLDEAQDGAMRTVIAASVGHGDANWNGYAHDARTLPEAGGTIGPLPDGTVIQVERVETMTLAAGIGQYLIGQPTARVIDAYNAAQAS